MPAKSLIPFYESISIRPLLNNSVVQVNDRTYRAERWFKTFSERKIGCQRNRKLTADDYIIYPTDTHCYVFIDITLNVPTHKRPFAKKPSDVVKLIKENKLIVTLANPY